MISEKVSQDFTWQSIGGVGWVCLTTASILLPAYLLKAILSYLYAHFIDHGSMCSAL